jgi:hypothetical protein
MKLIFNYLALAFFLIVSICVHSQVGINTTLPDTSAMLDVFSTNKGFLMPWLTTEQSDAISNPAIGLMIYNTTLKDSEINIGTPEIANWIGIKKPAVPMIYFDSGTSDLIIAASVALLTTDLTISPTAGSFLVTFNAQVSEAINIINSFDSSIGVADLASLYDELMEYPGGEPHSLTFGSGEILVPGVYDIPGAPSIAGELTLAGGDLVENPVFIIRAPGAFTTGVGATVLLTGNAKPENIFWVCGAAMSTGANVIMKGTMLGGGVGAGAVSLGATSNLIGRLFTKLGAVTLGANVIITAPTNEALVDFGSLDTFAMWSSNGGVSDVATATTTGDVGTAAGILAMSGAHEGVEYPAGTSGGPVVSASKTTYAVFLDGVEVVQSRRTLTLESSIVSIQAFIATTVDNTSVDVRWKVHTGSAKLTNRSFSLVRLEH